MNGHEEARERTKKTPRNRPSARSGTTLVASSCLFASPFDSRGHVARQAPYMRLRLALLPRATPDWSRGEGGGGKTCRVGWHRRPRCTRRECLAPFHAHRRARGRGPGTPGLPWAWQNQLQRFRLVGETFSADTRSLATDVTLRRDVELPCSHRRPRVRIVITRARNNRAIGRERRFIR